MGSYNLIQDRVDREDYRIGWRKKMKVKVPIGYCDLEMFEELIDDAGYYSSRKRESFTWTFETDCGKPIDIVFIKDEEEDE